MNASGTPGGNTLVITDDRAGGERLARWVAAAGERPVVVSGAETVLMTEGDDGSVDCVVADLDTDDPAAKELLQRLLSRNLFPGVPQLHLFRDPALRQAVVTRYPSLVAHCMHSPAGADEFQGRLRLIAEMGRLRRELVENAVRDPMTGVYDRRYVMLRLDEDFSRARRYRHPLSLVLFDIDQLRRINESHGQAAGDAAIRRVAELLSAQVRKEDLVGRVGDDAFGVVLLGNRFRGAAVLANKVRNEAEEMAFSHRDARIEIRVSAGVSSFPDNGSVGSAEDLMTHAEAALREAKLRGGNRVYIDEASLENRKRVVLLAEGDPTLGDLAEDLLGLDDLEVVRAGTTTALLETLRFRRPEVLVLDLCMGPDAEVILDRIQELYPKDRFPIVGLSRNHEFDGDRLARLGVDRYLTKPFSLSVLRGMVRELLDPQPVP